MAAFAEPSLVDDAGFEEELYDAEAAAEAAAAPECKVRKTIVPGKCFLCGKSDVKHKQAYGPCCEATVRGAIRDAGQNGTEQKKAFNLMKKQGGEQYRQAILLYQSRCSYLNESARRLKTMMDIQL